MNRFAIMIGSLAALAAPANPQRAESFADPVKKFIVADQPVILIRNARLWDGTGAAAKPGHDMLVRDGRIAAIGPKLASPAGATLIDAAGKSLVPGLVMMHEHLNRGFPDHPYAEPRVAQIMLAYGTTTARTAGGFDMEGDVAIKDEIAAGRIPGPDLDLTVYVNGPKPFLTLAGHADDAAVRSHIAYWNGRGATSIKLWFSTTPAIAEVAIDEARKRGMTVAAHLCATLAATAAAMGIHTLEHSLLAAYDIVPGTKDGECPVRARQTAMFQRMAALDPQGPEVGAILSTLVKHGVAIDPTMVGRDEGLCIPKPKPAPKELALLAEFDPQSPYGCWAGIDAGIWQRSTAFQAATAVRYQRMGGTLIMGTDMGVVQGAMAHEELERMVFAGLTPTEALVAATRNGATALKRPDIGTLEVGKRADFLLVDGKPDETISDIRKLTHVARDGIVYDPAKLYEDAKGKLR